MAQTSRLVIEISTEAAKRNAEIIRQELQRLNGTGSTTINITNNLSTSMNQASREMNSTRNAARSLVGTLGGMALVYKAIKAADEWTGLRNRLVLVTNSQTELNAAMTATFDIAQRTGSSWENTASVYQRFAQNAKELGVNQQRVAAITETVAKATALSGGSAQSASAALTQFGQALASGVLRGEEFNSIMEQAPGLAQALAKGLGVPVGSLRALSQEGKITAKAMIDALEKVSSSVDADFGKTTTTIGQSFTVLQNAITKLVGEGNSGAATALAGGLRTIAENLELVANTSAALAIGYVTKALVAGTIATKEKIVTYGVERAAALAQLQVTVQATTVEAARTAATVATIQSQIALAEAHIVTLTGLQRLAYVEGTLIPLRTALTGATVAATEAGLANAAAINAQAAAASRGAVAMGAFRALLGGPAGIIGLVAAAGTAFYLMRDSSDSATQSLAAQAETVDALAQKYRDLSLAKAISEIATLQAESEKAAKAMKDALSDAYGVVGGAFDLKVRPTEQIAAWQAIASRVGIVGDKALTTAQALAEMRRAGFDESDIAKASKAFVVYEEGEKKIQNTALAIGFLREESKTATDATDELAKKIGGQRLAVKVATDEVQKQSEAMQQQIKWQQEYAESATISTAQQAQLTKAVADYEKGAITAGRLAVIFGENVKIPKEARDSFVDQATKTDLAKVAFNGADGALKALTSATDGASKAAQEHNQKLKESEKAANAAQTAYQAYQKALLGSIQTAAVENKLLDRGYSGNKGKNLADVVKAFPTKAQIETPEGQQAIKDALALSAIQDQLAAKQDTILRSEKDKTKELQKQEKLNAKISDLRIKSGESTSGGNTHQGTLNLAKTIQDSFDVKYFSALNDKYHQGTSSKHAQGLAFDFSLKDAKESITVTAALNAKIKELGINAKVLNEYTNPSKRSTGGHIHVQFANAAAAAQYQQISQNGKQGKLIEEDLKDANKQIEVMLAAQKAIRMSYFNGDQKLAQEHQDKLKEINENFADSPERGVMLAKENDRYIKDAENYSDSLNDKLRAYTDYTRSEAELTTLKYAEMRRDVVKSVDFDDAQRQKALAAVTKMEQDELASIAIRNKQQILATREVYTAPLEFISKRYELEREQISLTLDKTQEWRNAMIDASKTNEFRDKQQIQSAAFGTFSSAFQLDDEAQRQNQYDLEMTQQAELLNQQLVTYEEYLQAKAEITKRYNDAESSLRLSQAGETLGSFASMFKSLQGEQSTAYRVMFAAQKGFAIAQSVMAIQAAMASSAMSLPFPANLGAMATVAAQMASIVSTISSVQPQGFANGGYTGAGGKYEPAGIVHKGEVVWSQSDVKRAGGVGTVESMRKGGASTGGNVVINNYGDNSVSTERDNNGDLVVTIQKEIDRYVPAQLSNPNSRISKSLGQNTQTMRRR